MVGGGVGVGVVVIEEAERKLAGRVSMIFC